MMLLFKVWLTEQNENARTYLDNLNQRRSLETRFEEILYLDVVSTPVKRQQRYFFTRRTREKEKAVLVVKEDGEERTLIDPNTLSNDGSISMRRWYPSRDGRYVAYLLSENNADEASIYILNVETGEKLQEKIEGAKYAGPSWTPDSKGFFYEYLPTDDSIPVADRPGYTELRYHQLGSSVQDDITVFAPTYDAETFLYGGISDDGKWLFVGIQRGWNQNDVYVRAMDTDIPKVEFVKKQAEFTTKDRVDANAKKIGLLPFAVGIDAKFDVTWANGYFYVKTDYKAPNGRILRVHPDQMDLSEWEEIIPEAAVTLEDFKIIGDSLVLSYIKNASSELKVYSFEGEHLRDIQLPQMGSVSAISGEKQAEEIFFKFTSFAVPDQIYQTSVRDSKSTVWSKIEVPIDTNEIEVKQVWYKSKDGTKVSMFIVHKADTKLDGKRPTLLYGYGGFNVV